jgi:hypothetical protein
VHTLNTGFTSTEYFAVGTTTGFKIYATDPLSLITSAETDHQSDNILLKRGGISCISVLQGSNLFAVVAGGKTPKFDRNSLVLYDDKMKAVHATLEFSAPVRSVRLHNGWLVAFNI